MRIISDFHDYYDSVQSHGQDLSVIYQRKTIEYDCSRGATPKPPAVILKLSESVDVSSEWDRCFRRETLVGKKTTVVLTFGVLFFCGKGYRYCYANVLMNAEQSQHHYNLESLEIHLQKLEIDFHQKAYRHSSRTIYDRAKGAFNCPVDISGEWLIENKVIVADCFGDKVEVNSCLKDMEFYKVFPVAQAYQELDMWISGTLSFPQNAMIELDDKWRAQAHGFDHKYAFRKEPTKCRK